MSDQPQPQQLHDKLSRGESLSIEERAELEQWYAKLDQEESAILGRAPVPLERASLQAQLQAALEQLAALTQRIQVQAAENERLRHEIAGLQQQLAQRRIKQPA